MNTPEWSPRVPRWKIRRLYELEAAGMLDEALVDDIGLAMLVRSRDILTATQAHGGKVRCPACSTTIERTFGRGEVVSCSSCSWEMPWDVYHRSYRKRQLVGGGALPGVERFIEKYPTLRDARSRMLEIDRLIHYFHGEARGQPVRPAARNVIGGSAKQVRELMDSLAEGRGTSPDVAHTRAQYREKQVRANDLLAEIRERAAARRAARRRPSDRSHRT